MEDVDLGLVALPEVEVGVAQHEATLQRLVDVQAAPDLDDPTVVQSKMTNVEKQKNYRYSSINLVFPNEKKSIILT